MADLDHTTPIEVFLTQNNLEVACLVAFEDESTTSLDVDSLSLRGAQREITGWLIDREYEPVGRWVQESDIERDAVETSRKFRPAKQAEEKS